MKKGKDKVHIVHNCEHIWEYFNTFISHLQLTLMRLSCICLNRGEMIQSPHMPGQWTIKAQNVWKVFKVIMKCPWHVIRCYGIMLISNAFIIENTGLSRMFWFQKQSVSALILLVFVLACSATFRRCLQSRIRVASYHRTPAMNVSNHKCLTVKNLKALVIIPDNVVTKSETKQESV